MNTAPDLSLKGSASTSTSDLQKPFSLYRSLFFHSTNLDINTWGRVIIISYYYNLYTTVRNSDRTPNASYKTHWHPNNKDFSLFPSFLVHIKHTSQLRNNQWPVNI